MSKGSNPNRRKKSSDVKNVVIIGSGNVATHFGIAIKNAGYKIVQVYSPDKKNASILAKKISGKPVINVNAIDLNANLYIIAVKDDAIKTIAKKLSLKDKIIVHTSGSTEMEVLKHSSENVGVLYPLQTLSKNTNIDFSLVPLFIESNNKQTENTLKQFAKKLSKIVHIADSEKRKYIHLAAVFACNFSNHMYSCAEAIAQQQKIPFSTFIPLIEETAKKISLQSPHKAQTGPALRADKKTIKLQQKLLRDKPRIKKLYKLISDSIRKSDKTF